MDISQISKTHILQEKNSISLITTNINFQYRSEKMCHIEIAPGSQKHCFVVRIY